MKNNYITVKEETFPNKNQNVIYKTHKNRK